jgi:hypothetical protein
MSPSSPIVGRGATRQAGRSNVAASIGELALLYTDGAHSIAGFDTGSQQVLITP